MQKFSILLICLSLSTSIFAINDSIPTDTLAVQEALSATNDDLLFVLLEQQKKELQAREDSLWQVRLEEDVTSVYPVFHLGLTDSLRIAEKAAKQKYHPLCQPLCFVKKEIKAIKRIPLTDVSNHENETPQLNAPADVYAIRQGARDYLVAHHAELYKGGIYNPKLIEAYRKGMKVREVHTGSPMQVHVSGGFRVRDTEEEKADALRKIREQDSFWRREATTMLQVTQNYATENWYQGSNNNFALLGIAKGFINYDNKKNITWENSGEWRWGMNTVLGDSLRKVNMNDDVFKLHSKLGVKVYKKLAIALAADFQTHFFNTWKENQKNLKTGPASPIRFTLALGLDYKPIDGLSLAFAPVTYKMIYVSDTVRVDVTSFGIESGNILNDVGSSVRAIWKYKPLREIELESDFYFYTNYKSVEIDWEVACNFIINRYLSACVTLHPRYDNTVILDGQDKAKLQFKELISIGFNHKFR